MSTLATALRDVGRVEIEVVGVRSAGIRDVDLVVRQIRDREIVIARAELDEVDLEGADRFKVIACAGVGGERGAGTASDIDRIRSLLASLKSRVS